MRTVHPAMMASGTLAAKTAGALNTMTLAIKYSKATGATGKSTAGVKGFTRLRLSGIRVSGWTVKGTARG